MSFKDVVNNRRRFGAAVETERQKQERIGRLAKGLMQQMREAGIPVLEMMEIGDVIVRTVATTVIEVAEPGEQRAEVRSELLAIVDRLRAAIAEGERTDG